MPSNVADQPYILVVDDAEELRDLLKIILEQGGYRVETAADGVEAIAMVGAHRPDLVLLDVEMPRMDGFEACRQLKENPFTEDIPVIFLTSEKDTQRIADGF